MNSNDNVKAACPVCGNNLFFLPWNGELSSLEICPRCLIHFGYDDEAGGDKVLREKIYTAWRDAWIKNGSLDKWVPTEEQICAIVERAKNEMPKT